MKVTRNIFIILYAVLLVINDPQIARAHTIEGIGITQAGIIENKPVYVEPYESTGQKAYHISYILNGGENRVVDGQEVQVRDELYGLSYPMISIDYPQSKCEAQYQELPDDAAMKTFLFETCKAEANWNMKNFIEDQVELIRKQVGDKKVLLALSGGVDSSVVAAMLIKAIGQQLVCVHVNHGLMRKNESEGVVKVFRDELHANLIYVDATERFLGKLDGVADPEEKRKIIGGEFIRVFEEEARKLEGIDFLGQGTIYPDIIESGTKTAKCVKSHHNVGGLPEKMNLKVVEPLRALFKDEVRRVGRALGIKEELVGRHPFPGPSLAIRIIGDITEEKLNVLREADNIFIKGLREYDCSSLHLPSASDPRVEASNLYDAIWQAGVILLPIKSVGVMGDERTYENPVALRAVVSTDAMTADWARLPYDFLAQVSNDIIRNVRGVNRVCYDVSSKPPSTIEWE